MKLFGFTYLILTQRNGSLRSLLAVCLRVEQTRHLYLLSPLRDPGTDTPERISSGTGGLSSPFWLLIVVHAVPLRHGSYRTPTTKSRQGIGMGERLIPRKRLSFYTGSELPPSPTLCFMSHWPELELELLLRQSLAEGNGIATFDSSSLGLARNRSNFHWDGGSFSTFVCSQKIRAGDSWVSN